MSSLLFIAYDFPPILSPESIQVQRRAIALAETGHRVHVLTSSGTPDFEFIDPALERLHENLTVHRVKKLPFEKALHYLCAPLQITDRKFWWKSPAAKKAMQIVRENGITHLYTHSTPLVNHLAGLAVKNKHPELRWTTHFSDPWTLNPYISYRTSLQRKANKFLEKNILELTDRITVTSEMTKDMFREGLGVDESTIRVLPHVFDPDLYPRKTEDNKKAIIAHTGHIYGLRTIMPLVEALESEKAQNLEFHFYGRIKEDERQAAEQRCPGLFKFFSPVPFLKSLEVLARADLLLVIDAPLENSPFFPSKLADYIGAKRPIAALTPASSTTTEILSSLTPLPLTADSGNVEGIRQLLRRIEEDDFKAPEREKADYYNMNNSYENIREALIDA